MGIVCPMCGEYDVSGSVIACGQLRRLPLEERGDLLSNAESEALRTADKGGLNGVPVDDRIA